MNKNNEYDMLEILVLKMSTIQDGYQNFNTWSPQMIAFVVCDAYTMYYEN